jgi:hypothetical protein
MEGQSPIICIDLDVNTSQLIDVGQKFIRDNPRYRDIPVARVLFDSRRHPSPDVRPSGLKRRLRFLIPRHPDRKQFCA